MDHHWVEELFQPKFTISKQNLTQELREGDEPGNEDIEKAFDKVAHRISPLDTSAIKNVYERVHLMTLLEAEEQEKRNKEQAPGAVKTDESTHRTSTPKLYGKYNQAVKDAASPVDDEPGVDLQDSCIWNNAELGVLRDIFKTAKHENARLGAQVKATTEDLNDIRAKYKDLSKILDKRTHSLHEAQKANKRLHIMCTNLQEEARRATEKLNKAEDSVTQLEDQNSSLLSELHQVRINVDEERLVRKKLEIDMERQEQKLTQRHHQERESQRLVYQEDINYMREKMAALSKELEEEKKSHERTKKGLEHLRMHFTATATFGEGSVSKAITKDQLKELDWKPR